jgi:lipoprotein NlpD
VTDRATSLRQPETQYRTVVHGDTLYSIAWESGRDYHELAAWNELDSSYTIVPGQKLRLYPPEETVRPAPAVSAPVPERKNSVRNSDRSSAGSAKGGKAASAAKATTSARRASRASSAQKTTKSADKLPSNFGSWIWPVNGKILRNYDKNGAGKGLDIAGGRGQAIQAAASGRVVYQGSGLRGYGQLIIIKHSDEYLSAYAHNDRIYVKEGDQVRRGQKIASMGSSGADQVMLHFEIRRNGAPVDPLRYLPKR